MYVNTFLAVFLLVSSLFSFASAQKASPGATATPTTSPTPAPVGTPKPAVSLERHFFKNIIHDQASIWTSPFRLRSDDLKWLVPFGVGTAALIATDHETSSWVQRNGGLPVVSHDASWAGKAYVTGGIAGAFYVGGLATHNRRARETGLLSAEALIDTGIVTRVLKLATQRPRPNEDNGRGRFFTGGSSFPSGHSSTVWSVATVVAYEYHDNPWIKYGAFAAATAVSMSRYSGRNHFLSDVVVGSAVGFGIGRFVYRKHHDPKIDDPDANAAPPKPTTKLMPTIIPFYYGRTRTLGGTLTWNL